MVNLRYHIVSILAVFSAFTLGVVLGTTVINDQVVGQINSNVDRLSDRLADQRRANDDLNTLLSVWERGGESLLPILMERALAGRNVALLVASPRDDTFVNDVVDAVTTAGGTVVGRIRLTPKWRLIDQTARDQLALAIDEELPGSEGFGLHAVAAERLAKRLSEPAVPDDDDLLRRLERSGFVDLVDAADGAFPPGGTIVIYVATADREPVPANDSFAMPFLRAFERTTVAVAEALGAMNSLSDQVTGDRELAETVVTVDHADTGPGRYALVTALRARLRGEPAMHLGIRRRTTGVVPTPSPSPSPAPR